MAAEEEEEEEAVVLELLLEEEDEEEARRGSDGRGNLKPDQLIGRSEKSRVGGVAGGGWRTGVVRGWIRGWGTTERRKTAVSVCDMIVCMCICWWEAGWV